MKLEPETEDYMNFRAYVGDLVFFSKTTTTVPSMAGKIGIIFKVYRNPLGFVTDEVDVMVEGIKHFCFRYEFEVLAGI